MEMNQFVKNLLKEELRYNTRLGDDKIEEITNSFITRLLAKRHTVALSFLNDVMYEAVKNVDPEIDYAKANALYTSAIKEYNVPIAINSIAAADDSWISR
jgi:hypothetical protein